jgi:hypothetical protein
VSRISPWSVVTDMERETETALVTRLRAGDPDAFDIVFDA